MINKSNSMYKWYVLALGTATHVLIAGMPYFCMPVLFKEISDDLGLSLVQVGMIWGVAGLPALFAAFFVGMLGDRFGTRKTLFIACLFSGITGALRGAAFGYNSLLIFTFLFGLAAVPFSFGVHKSAGEWFSGKQLGLANGILAAGMGIGNTAGSMFSATTFSPALGGWRQVMFIYGAVAIIISLFWLKTRKPVSGQIFKNSTSAGEAFKQSFVRVIRLKSVWLLSIALMFFSGCYSGVIGYLPLYLRGSGWSPVGADGALAALTGASVIGVIPLSFLSDRIGSRKRVVLPAITIYLVCVGLLSIFGNGLVFLLVILAGLTQEGLWAILITMVMETEGVGAENSGTALGMAMTFGGLGSFLAPPLGNRLAVINPGYAFIFWAVLVVVAVTLIYFVKETGWKKRGQPSEVAPV
jgi:MFS family permease